MVEKAKVSIIIPIYNIDRYLTKSIETACDQTYNNLEIILVDDGSTDNSPAICDEFSHKDERVKVIHKQNGGLSDARNAGIDAATGDYIYFLDGDDYISTTLIDSCVTYMDMGYDMVSFQYYTVEAAHEISGSADVIEKENGEIIIPQKNRIGEITISSDADRVDFFMIVLLRRIPWMVWNRMYRRSIIVENSIRFEDNKKIFAEDVYFNLCYGLHIQRMESIGDLFYYYRIREDSIMGKELTKLNVNRMNELTKSIYRYYTSHNASPAVMSAMPLIHYRLLETVVSRYKKVYDMKTINLRKLILDDIEDRKFFKTMLLRLIRQKSRIGKYYSPHDTDHIIKIAKYWLYGNHLVYFVDTGIIRFRDKARYKEFLNTTEKKTNPSGKRVYLIGTETFGNLGDGMIAETTVNFLAETLPGYQVVEIPLSDYWRYKSLLLKAIKKADVIFLAGGGNMGDVYKHSQNVKVDVINSWKDNIKIIFPQSIHYEGDVYDRSVFSKENNVILYVRESISFELAKSYYSCDTYMVPDIVLSCKGFNNINQNENKDASSNRKKEILFIIRGDLERKLTNEELRSLINKIEKMDYKISFSDFQQIMDGAGVQVRKQESIKKMLDYQRVSLVITDRLHGLILAAITGTPCIAISNFNHKIKGTYELISNLPYIRYADSASEAESLIAELSRYGQGRYETSFFDTYKKMGKFIADIVLDNALNENSALE